MEINGTKWEKSMDSRGGSFVKINDINKSLDCLGKKEKTQIKNIRNERGNITLDSTDINRRIREYHEQLYANKFGNSDELNNFFKDTNYQNSLKKQIT